MNDLAIGLADLAYFIFLVVAFLAAACGAIYAIVQMIELELEYFDEEFGELRMPKRIQDLNR